jgi:DMSO/TMAO reductase YedYZ molybdopterin-dependent catalytic subunit
MKLSRRRFLTGGLAAAGGFAGLAVAARIAEQHGLIPIDSGGLYGPGHSLTYAAQRLITRHSMAREFRPEQLSEKPFANPVRFKSDEFERLRSGGFADWRLKIEGLVERPGSFSIADLRAFPARSQNTLLACEEGWSYVAQWTGVPLATVLEQVKIKPEAKFVVYQSMEEGWKDAIDMHDALHPQTYLAHGFNGGDLPVGFGGPLRMRVPRQLGYKSVKFVNKLIVTDSLNGHVQPGEYSWYAGM